MMLSFVSLHHAAAKPSPQAAPGLKARQLLMVFCWLQLFAYEGRSTGLEHTVIVGAGQQRCLQPLQQQACMA